MKKNYLLLISALTLITSITKAQTPHPYYDAIKLNKWAKMNVGNISKEERDTIAKILSQYLDSAKTRPRNVSPNSDSIDNYITIDTFKNNNPFFTGLFKHKPIAGMDAEVSQHLSFGSAFSSIPGLDVTNIVNGIADIMIERAKEELTVAFFNRFQNFIHDNPEFRILFPKTTDNLNGLLSYNYPQMIPALRLGFFADLKMITFHLTDVIELPKYQALLSKLPEVSVVIRSLRVIHDLETGASNAADVIKDVAQFPEWDNINNTNHSNLFKDFGNAVKLAAIFSESVRDSTTNDTLSHIWISSKDWKQNMKDSTFFKIFSGLIWQLCKKEDITFYGSGSKPNEFADLLKNQKTDILLFQNKIASLIDLSQKVNDSYNDITKRRKLGQKISNEDYYNYINVSIDVMDYALGIVKIFDASLTDDNYVNIAKKTNNLYRDIYSQQYTQSVSDAIDIITGVQDLFNSNPNKKDAGVKTLDSLISFANKVKPYALFMANMVEAKTSDDVKNALENVILPVGSSSIKKSSKFNISVQTYLGPYLSTSNGPNSSISTWSDKFGITAPIGISFSHGFNKGRGKNFGSASLFISVFDIGAIVDYKLQRDSTINPNNTVNQNAVSKNYSIKLGQIFSPGIYAVYGLFANLPLSIGYGFQYGPGLSKINVDNTTIITSPSVRWNLFLAVDLPFFTIHNTRKQ